MSREELVGRIADWWKVQGKSAGYRFLQDVDLEAYEALRDCTSRESEAIFTEALRENLDILPAPPADWRVEGASLYA